MKQLVSKASESKECHLSLNKSIHPHTTLQTTACQSHELVCFLNVSVSLVGDLKLRWCLFIFSSRFISKKSKANSLYTYSIDSTIERQVICFELYSLHMHTPAPYLQRWHASI